MDIFFIVLKQMLMMVTLILVGILVKKKNIISDGGEVVLSRILTYILVPALYFNTMVNHCTVENFAKNYKLILYGGVIVVLAIVIASPVSKLFVKKSDDEKQEYLRNIYRYAIIFSNTGYIGSYVVLGSFGEFMLYKYQMFLLVFSIVCNSYGLMLLTPREKGLSVMESIKKALLSVPVMATFLGMICGLLNVGKFIPEFLSGALSNAANSMGPMAMILAGLVIGENKIIKLLSNIKVYWLTLLRLIVIPAIFALLLALFNVEKEIVILTILVFACPIGMNTIVFTAAFGGDTKTGASMTVISSFLSTITIPLMYYVFNTII